MATPDFDYEAPRTQEVAPPRPEGFPALQTARSRAAGASASGRTLNDALTARPLPAATATVFLDTGIRRLDSSTAGRPPTAKVSATRSDFPSISGWTESQPSAAAPAAYMFRSNSTGSVSSSASGRGSGAPTADNFPSLRSSRVAAPVATVAVQVAAPGGPSEGLRRANKVATSPLQTAAQQ